MVRSAHEYFFPNYGAWSLDVLSPCLLKTSSGYLGFLTRLVRLYMNVSLVPACRHASRPSISLAAGSSFCSHAMDTTLMLWCPKSAFSFPLGLHRLKVDMVKF